MARKGNDQTSDPAPASSPAGMHYKVLARRWRPQQFADLVGQEAIAQALQGAITAERVAHAYLFTGARGVGKTTTARILAKALNCKTGPTTTPCGTCDSCESVTSGDDLDVLEIDGASNRGIDEVRELRQNANLRPTRGRYKIYIIDEVHMLTREAFNALLKTLEEPPSHVKFIFATTDPQKIPVTILSRCQRFDFGTIASERIEKRLDEIVSTEGIAVDDGVLELVTRRAAGSMRDSLSLLDQLLAFGGERVTTEQVHRLLGTASEDRLMELVAGLFERQPGRAIDVVDQAEREGVQLGELLDQLIEYFRDLMVVKTAGAAARLVSVTGRHRDQIVEQAGRVSLDFIFAASDLLAETKGRLRGSNYGRVLLDMALVRVASLEDLAPLAELAERLQAIELRLTGGAVPARPAATAPTPARPGFEPDAKKKALAAEAPAVPAGEPTPRAAPATSAATAAAAGVASARAATSGADQSSPLPAEAAAEPLAAPVTVRVESGQTAPRGPTPPPAKRSSYSERISDAKRDPLVREAMELFSARVIHVDEKST